MRRTWLRSALGAAATTAVVAACTLNPQPLPPDQAAGDADGGRNGAPGVNADGGVSDSGRSRSDAGVSGDAAAPPPNEAGAGGDAATDAPDSTDAADSASDASDADAD